MKRLGGRDTLAGKLRHGAAVLGPTGCIALLLVVWFALAAAWPQLMASVSPFAIHPADAFTPPGPGHVFGTDENGRDVWVRIVYGARQSLGIGLGATAIAIGLAIVLALIAGLGPKWADAAVNRVIEVTFAFPVLVLALFLIAVMGVGIWPAIIAVGISSAPGYARILRTQVLDVARSDYVRTAEQMGLGRARVTARHILPNVLWPLAALATLGIGQAVVWASALSYLGVGAVPPAAEWGAMLNAGRTYLQVAWWLTFFPGIAIVASAAAATVLGRRLQAGVRQR